METAVRLNVHTPKAACVVPVLNTLFTLFISPAHQNKYGKITCSWISKPLSPLGLSQSFAQKCCPGRTERRSREESEQNCQVLSKGSQYG